MPNAFAQLMLVVWPLVAVALFNRLDPARALIWTILGGYLILPPIASFVLPVLPDLDKVTIPNLMALILCLVMVKDRPAAHSLSWQVQVLVVLFVFSPLATAFLNPDPIPFVTGGLPGLGIQDAVGTVAKQAVLVLPFLLGRRFLATPEALRATSVALVIAGLGYSLPMLIEVRLSPQINVWVYGFFQHSFEQMMRQGGYRPMVFLEHGLWAAFFAMMTLIAALALLREGPGPARPRWLAAAIWLGLVVVLCKSLGALSYAVALTPLVLFGGRRLQILVAVVLAAIVLCYPLLRGAGLVPLDDILARAAAISEERAASLRFRFVNEEILIARANERPLFGWGSWGRNLVHDPVSGQITSISDGWWVIVLGTFGWVGYVAQFGLLVLPLLHLARTVFRRGGAAVSPHACVLALLLAVNLLDLLPNATIIPFTWLMAGALLGHAEALKTAVVAGLPRPFLPPAPRTII